MKRYRYVCGTVKGPWRSTQREAKADAVEAGFGSWDEHIRDRPYTDEIVVIETKIGLAGGAG